MVRIPIASKMIKPIHYRETRDSNQRETKRMSILEIGCCGAYCKTCPSIRMMRCQGCKTGYENGEREIGKAKCKMKICCIKKELNTCADCAAYSTCSTVQGFYGKKNYKYKKYKEATLFIRERGYSSFLEVADKWKNQYGKFK